MIFRRRLRPTLFFLNVMSGRAKGPYVELKFFVGLTTAEIAALLRLVVAD